MSWSHYVDGLTFGPAVVGEHNTLLTEHSATGTAFQCFVGGPDCHAPGSIMGGLSVDVAALVAARPDADYWAFFVNGFGAGGFSFGEDGCSGPACGPILLYRTFITIDGSYVSARTGVSVPADLENVPGTPITIGETEIDPDSDEWHWSYALVNGVPSWPVPDLDGNTYGTILFTPAEAPSAISWVETDENVGHPAPELPDLPGARLRVEAIPFYEGDAPVVQSGCVIGDA